MKRDNQEPNEENVRPPSAVRGSRLGSRASYIAEVPKHDPILPTVKVHFPSFKPNVAPPATGAMDAVVKLTPRPPASSGPQLRPKSSAAHRQVGRLSTGILHLSKQLTYKERPNTSSGANRRPLTDTSSCFLTQRPSMTVEHESHANDSAYCFDNYFKSNWFRDREEWLRIAHCNPTRGKSLYFESTGDVYGDWADCIVKSYNAKTGKFWIEFVHSGIEKQVFRTNLLLPSIDDESEFLRQREIYFKETKLIYELVRCQRFVSHDTTANATDLGTLSLKIKSRITHLAIRRNITNTLNVHGSILADMLRVIDDDYTSIMKRSKAEVEEDSTPLHSALVRSYLQQQRLTHWCHQPHIPSRLLAFSKVREKIVATHLDATRASVLLLQGIMKKSHQVLPTVELFHQIESDYDAAKHRLRPPYSLQDYVAIQQEHLSEAFDVCQFEWRQEIIQLIEGTKIPSALQPNMHRFTKRVDYILANELSQSLEAAFGDLHETLFGRRCKHVTESSDNTRPVSTIRRRNWSAMFKPRLKPPLIQLVVVSTASNDAKRTVSFHPTLVTVQLAMEKLVFTAISRCMEIYCIQGESSLNSAEDVKVTKRVPLLRKSREVTALGTRAMKEFRASFNQAVLGPRQLAENIQILCDSLHDRRMALLALYKERTDDFLPPDDFNGIIDELRWFGKAIHDVHNLVSDVEQFQLVEITTADMKKALTADIERTMQDAFEYLCVNCHHQERRIADKYEQDRKTLATNPQDEATLDILWTFLSEIENVVHDRRMDVQSIEGRFTTLESIGIMINKPVPASTTKFHWTLRKYPSILVDDTKTCSDACEARKKTLSSSLFMEKRAFEAEVVRLKEAIDVLTTKTEWSKENVDVYADDAQTLHDTVEACLRQLEDFARRDRIFGWTPMETTNVTLLQALLEPYYLFWTTSSDFTSSTTTWSKTPFELLTAKDVVNKVGSWKEQLSSLAVQLGKHSKLQGALATLNTEVQAFCVGMPIIEMAATGAMKSRHWETIVDLLEVDSRVIQDDRLLFTLDDLIRGGIISILDYARSVHDKALREFHLEQRLHTLKREFGKPIVQVEKYPLKDTYLVVNFGPLLDIVEDQLITIYQMSHSDDVGPIANDVDEWKLKLQYTQNLLQTWTQVQRTWRSMECYFYRQKEGDNSFQDFAKVESTWRSVLDLVRGNPGLAKIADSDNVKEPLEKCLRILRSINKVVNSILETKRSIFPKLFLISNFDLARILAAQCIQDIPPKLNGLFEGIDCFAVDDNDHIHGITLKTRDTLHLIHPVAISKPNIDGWFVDVAQFLMALDKSIKYSIQHLIASTCLDAGMNAVFDTCVPLQVILVVLQIHWTSSMECDGDDRCGHDSMMQTLLGLEHGLIAKIRSSATDVNVATVLAEVISLVHKTKSLVHCNTTSFEWLSQSRRYLRPSPDHDMPTHVVQILDTELPYQNELLCIRQPQTNISTDNMLYSVFIALRHLRGLALQGFHIVHTAVHLTQWIGASLVVEVLSKETTWKNIGQVLRGAAATGSWLLLHHLNDAPTSILSILVQVMAHVSASHVLHPPVIQIPHFSKVELQPSFALLTTVNKRTRTELPPSLSAMFMPCSLIQPCLLQYTMSTLYIFGFMHFETIGKRIVRFLETMRIEHHNLSSDITLTALLSHVYIRVLIRTATCDLASHTIQAFKMKSLDDEVHAVYHAIEKVFLARLSRQDVTTLTRGILDKTFGVPFQVDATNALTKDDIQRAMATWQSSAQLTSLNVDVSDYVVSNLNQFLVNTDVYLCTLVSGAPVSGKSTLVNVAAAARTVANPLVKVKVMRVYVSSVENLMGSFYGEPNLTTCSVLQHFIHDATTSSNTVTWIVLDGVASEDMTDALVSFLEQQLNMRLFNMAKGIQHKWRLLIETDSLAHVNPSFASVCGHIYMDATCLTWRQILTSWCHKPARPSSGTLHSKAVVDLVFWVMTTAFALMPPKHPSMAHQTQHMLSVCRLVDMMVESVGGWPAQGHQAVIMAEGCFVFAAVWCIGTTLDDVAVKQTFSDSLKDVLAGVKKHMRRSSVPFPPNEPTKSVFDYAFDMSSLTWRGWDGMEPPLKVPVGIVPHTNFSIGSYFQRIVVANKPMTRMPLVLSGPTACGKTTLLQALATPALSQQVIPGCRHRTSFETKMKILDPLVEIRQNCMGTRTESTHIVILEDVHVCASTGLDCVREWVERNQSWHVENRSVAVPHAVFLATMHPMPSTDSTVTHRILRHFLHIRLAQYTDDVLRTICMATIQQSTSSSAVQFPFGNEIATSTARLVHHLRGKKTLGWNVLSRGLDIVRVVCTMPGEVYASSGVSMLWSHECQREYEDVFRSSQDVEWFRQHLVTTCRTVFGDECADKLVTTFRLNPLMYSPNVNQPNCYEEIFRIKYMTDTMSTWGKTHRHVASNAFMSSSQAGFLARVLRVLTLPLRVHHRTTCIFAYGPSGGNAVLASTFELVSEILDCAFRFETQDGIVPYLQSDKDIATRKIVLVQDAHGIPHDTWNDIQTLLDRPSPLAAAGQRLFVVFVFDVDLSSPPLDDGCITTYSVLCDRPSLYKHTHIIWLVNKTESSDYCQIIRNALKNVLVDHPMRDELIHVYADIQELNEMHLTQFGSTEHASSITRFDFSTCLAALVSHTTAAIKQNEKLLSTALTNATQVTTSINNIAGTIRAMSKRIYDKTQRAADSSLDLVPLQQSVHDTIAAIRNDEDEIHRESVECDAWTEKLKTHMEPLDKDLRSRLAEVLAFTDEWMDEPRLNKLPMGLTAQMGDIVVSIGSQMKSHRESIVALVSDADDTRSKKGSVRFTLQRMLVHFAGTSPSVLSKIKFMSNMAKADMHTQTPCVQSVMGLLDYIVKWHVGFDASKKMSTKIQDGRGRIQAIQARRADAFQKHCTLQNQLDMTLADQDSRKHELVSLERDMEKLRQARSVIEASQDYLDENLSKWNELLEFEQQKLAWVPGMCAIAASIFVYLKPYPWPAREKVLHAMHQHLQIHQVAMPSDKSMGYFVQDRIVVECWHLHGLPRSPFFVSNALLTANAIPSLAKWTVLIDPDGVGKTWLTSYHRGTLVCTTAIETVLQRAILRAIKLNHPLLIEHVEGQFSGSLKHFLKVRHESDGTRYLSIDDKMERISAEWPVYFTTPLRYPTFAAVVHRACHIVNFSVSSVEAPDFFDTVCFELWDDKEFVKRRDNAIEFVESWTALHTAEHDLLVYLSRMSPTDGPDNDLLAMLQDVDRKNETNEAKKDEAATMMDNVSKMNADAVAPILLLMFESFTAMGLINPNYTVSMDEFVRPLRTYMTKLRSQWQVATLRGGLEARPLLERSSSRRLTATASTTTFRKKTLKKVQRDVYPPEHKELIGAFSAIMTKLIHGDHVILWRFIFTANRILFTPTWKIHCNATTKLFMDIAWILDNRCYAFPVSGVDQLRRPPWVAKASWANLCVITKHRGYEYMYDYVLTHEDAIVRDECDTQAYAHLNDVAALLHKFVLLLCLQSPRKWDALNNLMQFAWEDISPCLPTTSLVDTVAGVVEATDQVTPIVLYCDSMPNVLLSLQEHNGHVSRGSNQLLPILSGENATLSTVLEELDRSATCGTWMCLYDCNHTSIPIFEKISLAWQEAIHQKPHHQHRLWLICEMHRPMNTCILTNAAKRWFLNPITNVKMAILSCAATLENDAAACVQITQWDAIAKGIVVISHFHYVFKTNLSYFDWVHHAPVHDGTVNTAAKELVMLAAKGIASLGPMREGILRVYAAHVVTKHDLDRLHYLFDWTWHMCLSAYQNENATPTSYALCRDWVIAAQVPFDFVKSMPTPLPLEQPVNVLAAYRHCFAILDGYDVANNDQSLVNDLTLFSHELNMSFYDVLASARTMTKSSELHRYLNWEWQQFSRHVTHIQRTLAHYSRHIGEYYELAQRALLGQFPPSWYLTPQFRMRTCADLLAHVKRRRKYFHSVDDGTFTSYWLPALTNPHRAVELLAHHIMHNHPEKQESWEHLRTSFVVAESLHVRSPLIYRLAKQRIKLRKAATADTSTSSDITLSGIVVYNASWNESTRTLTKPSVLNVVEELPSIQMTVTKTTDVTDPFSYDQEETDVHEIPVHMVDNKTSPPTQQVVFYVWLKLPDDDDERRWLLANAYLVIG
ncbi:hypothetical protein H310_07022 [Aphanomyces invadans]|uniref:Dynein heavy chain linker domain-containing protein n=1 Tax=Aphanomyces invadans TaxID=157072 RepID=A0A024U2E2_9STRA|nr:hypothetical protein H310_07022 [Aphanomyces invadans]ETW00380.1 hypothetical protein H310_07022 [Aphanomyces invadans]|eukprot:XP_008870515.1 hypothetical protein H310_07022 [Aphanomyces invadans]